MILVLLLTSCGQTKTGSRLKLTLLSRVELSRVVRVFRAPDPTQLRVELSPALWTGLLSHGCFLLYLWPLLKSLLLLKYQVMSPQTDNCECRVWVLAVRLARGKGGRSDLAEAIVTTTLVGTFDVDTELWTAVVSPASALVNVCRHSHHEI